MRFCFDDSPEKKKRAKKDPDAPKRAMNAFLFFANETHRTIQSYASFRLRVAETSSHAAELWKKMSVADKEKYVKMAKEDKARYDKEMIAYLKEKKRKANAEKKEKGKGGKK